MVLKYKKSLNLAKSSKITAIHKKLTNENVL